MNRVVLVAKALSDPVRVRMLEMLTQAADEAGAGKPGGMCVCHFVKELGMGQSRVSYHMRVLREAGLVAELQVGKWTYYSLQRYALTGFIRDLEDRLTAAAGE
ncbi:hypothetical protein SY88_08030 [Clostridiales bacterium PH28_bin88]|nr:hypothetical protein SY88_08030 [Clostridiales bacterium PH28_bin88]